MPYRIAGVDVHKKMLAVVVTDVDVEGEWRFTRRQFGTSPSELRTAEGKLTPPTAAPPAAAIQGFDIVGRCSGRVSCRWKPSSDCVDSAKSGDPTLAEFSHRTRSSRGRSDRRQHQNSTVTPNLMRRPRWMLLTRP